MMQKLLSAASPARRQAAASEAVFSGAGLRGKLVTARVYGVTSPSQDELAFVPAPLSLSEKRIYRARYVKRCSAEEKSR